MQSSSSSTCSSGPLAKKRKWDQKYRPEWTSRHPGIINSSKKGSTYVFCTTCNDDLSIKGGGYDDIRKHLLTAKHKKLQTERKATQSLADFMTKPKPEDLSLIRAETLFTNFLIDHNIAMAVSDDFGDVLRKMVPDSAIAKKYACGRTKSTAISKVLACDLSRKLAMDMNKFGFSLSTDGSNDNSDKLYPMVVRSYNEETGLVGSRILSVPQLSEASTAVNIADLCHSQLQHFGVDTSRFLAFASDNAAVMVGRYNGVTVQLQKDVPHLLTVGCACHLLDLAVKKALKPLPVKIDELMLDVFYFLEPSDKRIREFQEYQLFHNEEVRKILKYCPTRWLSLSKCVQRLIELWAPLKEFIEKYYQEEKKKALKKRGSNPPDHDADNLVRPPPDAQPRVGSGFSNARLKRIRDLMQSKKTLACLNFLDFVLKVFLKANVALQHDKPLVHKVVPILLGAYRELLVMLFKPSAITSINDITTLVPGELTAHMDNKDLFFGAALDSVLRRMSSSSKSEFLLAAKMFLVEALVYMRKKFPFHDPTLIHARVVDINRKQGVSNADLNFFLERLPFADKDKVYCQFRLYTSYPIPPQILELERCDSQWHEMRLLQDATGDYLFRDLSDVMLSILSVPHSNAAAERAFSMVRKNRTTHRSSMSTETLGALLITKFNRDNKTVVLSDTLLRECKSSTFNSLK